MEYQSVFKRYEIKYLLNESQRTLVLELIDEYMALDRYGRSSIRSLYFDTEDYRLIRSSIEKPLYKEKLRLRSYGRAPEGAPVFAEIKKKYRGVVYKRRVIASEAGALGLIAGKSPPSSQIEREIAYLSDFYGRPLPRLLLSYEREAYYMKDGGDFRLTLDDTVLAREDNLTLDSDTYGEAILPTGYTLMELKCSGGIPLWLARGLSEAAIYKTSFSKYGRAYAEMILPRQYNKFKEI